MAGFNRIIMVGNLTRDPEYKQLASGQAVCRLGLAANRQFRNRQTGQLTQEVCFVDVDVWGQQAETSKQYLTKGRSVLIEGRLKLDTWQDQEGNQRSKHSIVADRVVFLNSGAQATSFDEAGASEEQKLAIEEQTLEQVKALAAGKGASTGAPKRSRKTHTAENELKDEPPFADDLPF